MPERDRNRQAADRIRPWADLIGGLLRLAAAIVSWFSN
jgi:hypothetical protein